jgi:hypothetical protein
MEAMRPELFGLVRAVVLIGAAAGALVLACSSFSAESGAGPADEAGADGATSDAPTPPGDAGSDASAEAAALLRNGGFETPNGVACAPGWSVSEGSATTAAGLGVGGSVGCLLCNNKAVSGNGSVLGAPITNPPRGSYTLQAYARQGPDGGAINDYLVLTATLADGGVAQAVPDQVPVSAFAPQSATLDVPAGATSLVAGLEVYADAGGCAVFDDVTLTYFAPP